MLRSFHSDRMSLLYYSAILVVLYPLIWLSTGQAGVVELRFLCCFWCSYLFVACASTPLVHPQVLVWFQPISYVPFSLRGGSSSRDHADDGNDGGEGLNSLECSNTRTTRCLTCLCDDIYSVSFLWSRWPLCYP